jgi:hypothetical protein
MNVVRRAIMSTDSGPPPRNSADKIAKACELDCQIYGMNLGRFALNKEQKREWVGPVHVGQVYALLQVTRRGVKRCASAQ